MRGLEGAFAIVVATATVPAHALAHDRSGIVVERAGAGTADREDPRVLERTLEDRIGAHLRERGIGPRRSTIDPVVTVRIHDGADGQRSFAIDARAGTRILEDARAAGRCSECDAPALAEAVVRALGPAIVAIRALELGPRPAPREPEVLAAIEPAPLDPPPPPARLDERIVGGWASLAAGIAAIVSGAVFIGVGEIPISAPGRTRLEAQDFRPTGIVVASVGAGAVLAGGILLAISAPSERRSRRRGTPRMALRLGFGLRQAEDLGVR